MYEGQWSLAIYVYVCVSYRALSHYMTGYAPGLGPIEQVTMVCLQGGSFVRRVSNRHYSILSVIPVLRSRACHLNRSRHRRGWEGTGRESLRLRPGYTDSRAGQGRAGWGRAGWGMSCPMTGRYLIYRGPISQIWGSDISDLGLISQDGWSHVCH